MQTLQDFEDEFENELGVSCLLQPEINDIDLESLATCVEVLRKELKKMEDGKK